MSLKDRVQSTSPIFQELICFVSSKSPQVIALQGEWGSGKTFLWENVLAVSHSKNLIALKHYSYVSLFGLTSASDLKSAIYNNTVSKEFIYPSSNIKLSKTPIQKFIQASKNKGNYLVQKYWKKTTNFIVQNPYVVRIVGDAPKSWFSNVSNCLICIDDVERRSSKLPLDEIFGLVNQLRERKNCSVIMIFDQVELGGAEDLKKYGEKVLDKTLNFKRQSIESYHIAANAISSEYNTQIEKFCTELGINNIRIIKRIISDSIRVLEILSSFSETVKLSALHSLVLFKWMKLSPKESPPFSLIKLDSIDDFVDVDHDRSDVMVSWKALLNRYQYVRTDELDLAILEGVQDGYFNEENMLKSAHVKEREVELENKNKTLMDAMKYFHADFNGEPSEFVEKLANACINNTDGISLSMLQQVVGLLRNFNEDKKIEQIVELYIKQNEFEPDALNIERYSFHAENTFDPYIRKRFAAHKLKSKKDQDVRSILAEAVKKTFFTEDDMQFLADSSWEEFRDAFKSMGPGESPAAITLCLQSRRVVNASENEILIVAHTFEALQSIASENLLNQVRMKVIYGITQTIPAAL